MKRTIGVDRGIGKSARSVASDSVPAETFQPKNDALVEEAPACGCADTSSFLGSVVSPRCGSSARGRAKGIAGSKLNAGKDAVSEPVDEAEDFIMAKARIEGDLGDDIGCRIECIRRGTVVAQIGRAWCRERNMNT